MKLKLDKTFMIILGLIFALGISMNIQHRTINKLRQENLYYQGKNKYLEEYGVTLEQCLWTLCERIPMKKAQFTALNEKTLSAMPVNTFVINCCRLEGDSIREKTMLEVLGYCRKIKHLQVITDSSWVETVSAVLRDNETSRIWIPENKEQEQQYPAVFFIDEKNRACCGFSIHPQTIQLFIRYLRFVQNQYGFESYY